MEIKRFQCFIYLLYKLSIYLFTANPSFFALVCAIGVEPSKISLLPAGTTLSFSVAGIGEESASRRGFSSWFQKAFSLLLWEWAAVSGLRDTQCHMHTLLWVLRALRPRGQPLGLSFLRVSLAPSQHPFLISGGSLHFLQHLLCSWTHEVLFLIACLTTFYTNSINYVLPWNSSYFGFLEFWTLSFQFRETGLLFPEIQPEKSLQAVIIGMTSFLSSWEYSFALPAVKCCFIYFFSFLLKEAR